MIDDNKFPVIVGGEHTVTLGAFRAFHNKYPDITCLSLDAHADLRDSYSGSAFSHACVMRRISEINKPVLFGIRSIDISESEYADKKKIPIFFTDEIVSGNLHVNSLLRALGERVYLSIDMDVFDPASVPAVGNPEPGGLDWYKILNIIKEVNRNSKILGVDLVEIAPIKNQVHSEFTAAKLIYKILAYIFQNN